MVRVSLADRRLTLEAEVSIQQQQQQQEVHPVVRLGSRLAAEPSLGFPFLDLL